MDGVEPSQSSILVASARLPQPLLEIDRCRDAMVTSAYRLAVQHWLPPRVKKIGINLNLARAAQAGANQIVSLGQCERRIPTFNCVYRQGGSQHWPL